METNQPENRPKTGQCDCYPSDGLKGSKRVIACSRHLRYSFPMKNGIALTLLAMFGTVVFCTAVRANVTESLPDVFLSVLAEIKAKTRVPVLLPSELSRPFNDAKHATVEATENDYAVILYYQL